MMLRKSSSSLPVFVHEGLHEVAELLHSLDRHAIVDRGSAASHGAVPCEGVELYLFGLFEELLLQRFVAAADGERDVHSRAAGLFHRAVVESIGAVNDIVQHPALLVRKFVPVAETALGFGVLQVLAHGVEREARGGVVHGAIVGCGLEACVSRADLHLSLSSCEVVTQDAHRNTRRSQILLHSSVDVGVLGHVDGLRAEVRGHVGHQGDIANVGRVVKLNTIHCLVHTVMDVGSLGVQLPLGFLGDGGELAGFCVASDLSCSVLDTLLLSLLAPLASDEVICLGLRTTQEVQRDCCKLERGPSLHEEDLIVGRNSEDVAHVLLGFVRHGCKFLGAVGHLEDAHAAALVVDKLLLHLLEDFQRHHARSSREIVDASFRHGCFKSLPTTTI
mmetsp:Transcript_84969/g.177589  ORF Transcript_84969/g.177589 Transcript_84969/m.177589 type:complete len:390 (+) Transcript_84969:154-1323(+)